MRCWQERAKTGGNESRGMDVVCKEILYKLSLICGVKRFLARPYLLHFLAVVSQKVGMGGAVSTDAEIYNLWAPGHRNVSENGRD